MPKRNSISTNSKVLIMLEAVMLTQFERIDNLPGPKKLVAGNDSAGYYGTLPVTDFVTGDFLASTLGLTAGTSINSTTDWLKFSYKGRTLFVPKLPLRHTLSWSDINNSGAVFGTGRITIQGRPYKVRLMKGSNVDPYTGPNNAADDPNTWTSEYNALMYRVCTVDPPSQSLPNFVAFTPEQLGMYTTGGVQLCQEVSAPSTGDPVGVVCRGNGANNISTIHSPAPSYAPTRGWRPVLELA